MQLPLVYHDATLVEEIPTPLWGEFFEAVGWPASLDAHQELRHVDITRALQADVPTDELLSGLATVFELGSEAGREAIAQALRDRALASDRFPSGAGARACAMRLFLEQRFDPALREVMARAQIAAGETAGRRRYAEFIGIESRSITRLAKKAEKLEQATRMYCDENDLGSHVQVRAFEDDDLGTCTFQVVRTHRTKAPLAVAKGEAARAPLEFRPVHGDVLRYETSTGRLRIAARAPTIVEFYRRTLGELVFGDPEFFPIGQTCSLDVLQHRGEAALRDHGVPEVADVRLVACSWDGGATVLTSRGRDCLEMLRRVGALDGAGRITEAAFKVAVVGRSARPVRVSVRVPRVIDVAKQHEEVIDRLLSAMGIRLAASDTQDSDLWSLHPWRHPRDVWQQALAAQLERAVGSGALRRVYLDSIDDPDDPGGATLRVTRLDNGDFYAVADDQSVPSRTLSATDVEGLELVPDLLRQLLVDELGTGGSVGWSGESTLDLGVIKIEEHEAHLLYALRPPTAETIALLEKLNAAGSRTLLLVPTTRDVAAPHVPLRAPLPNRREIVRAVAVACGLADRVSASLVARDGAELIVDTTRGEVFVHDVLIPGLTAETHPFRFVEALARADGRPVAVDALKALLSPNRDDDTVAVRQAKTKAGQRIATALAAVGRSLTADAFPVYKGGYRTALIPHVR